MENAPIIGFLPPDMPLTRENAAPDPKAAPILHVMHTEVRYCTVTMPAELGFALEAAVRMCGILRALYSLKGTLLASPPDYNKRIRV